MVLVCCIRRWSRTWKSRTIHLKVATRQEDSAKATAESVDEEDAFGELPEEIETL
jgi:hypothetical protein